MKPTDPEIIRRMSQFVTEERLCLIQKVLSRRTRRLTVALENIYQGHNASACLRTAESVGIQEVHVIENGNRYKPNPDIALGADKWLDICRHDQTAFNTHACYDVLRKQGYQIVATCLREDAVPLGELDVSRKTALVFGTEETGLSDYAVQNADCGLIIPMRGFTQSLNVSVSVAVCLYALREKMESEGADMSLSEEEKNKILLNWLIRSAPNGEKIHRNLTGQSSPQGGSDDSEPTRGKN